MAYERALYATLENEYEELRRHNEEDLLSRRAAVYSRIPEIEALDQEIQSAGLSIVSLAVSNPPELSEKLALLRDRQKALLLTRSELLRKNGYPEDELSMRYMCNACQDTGAIGSTPCECYRRRLIMKTFEKSNLSLNLRTHSFKTFDLSLYASEPDPEHGGASARENIEKILKVSGEFIENFEKPIQNLLFYGEPGLGKTFLSTCIAKELMKKGYSVIYETTYQIVSSLEDYKFNRSENPVDAKKQIDRLYESDLLILDDLGAEFSTPYTNAALFDILNSRMIANKKTIISTNLTPKEISERYSERVISRIFGCYKQLEFFGSDIRLK